MENNLQRFKAKYPDIYDEMICKGYHLQSVNDSLTIAVWSKGISFEYKKGKQENG